MPNKKYVAIVHNSLIEESNRPVIPSDTDFKNLKISDVNDMDCYAPSKEEFETIGKNPSSIPIKDGHVTPLTVLGRCNRAWVEGRNGKIEIELNIHGQKLYDSGKNKLSLGFSKRGTAGSRPGPMRDVEVSLTKKGYRPYSVLSQASSKKAYNELACSDEQYVNPEKVSKIYSFESIKKKIVYYFTSFKMSEKTQNDVSKDKNPENKDTAEKPGEKRKRNEEVKEEVPEFTSEQLKKMLSELKGYRKEKKEQSKVYVKELLETFGLDPKKISADNNSFLGDVYSNKNYSALKDLFNNFKNIHKSSRKKRKISRTPATVKSAASKKSSENPAVDDDYGENPYADQVRKHYNSKY